MNSATANSSDTPSRTLMEVSPFSGVLPRVGQLSAGVV
jgi:hypothetical protein